MGISAVAAGLALSAVGTGVSVMASQKSAAASSEIARQEQQAEAVRQHAMELDARRRQLEMVRQQQMARSTALTATTAQGASFGSALPGAYGQASGQIGTNILGVQQNEMLGQQLFGINSQISQQKMNMASAQGLAGIGGGLSSLGGAALTASPYMNAFSKNFGIGGKPFQPWGGHARYGW